MEIYELPEDWPQVLYRPLEMGKAYPVYLWLLKNGSLQVARYEPKLIPMDIHEEREFWWEIPVISAARANELMRTVAPLLDGYLEADEKQRQQINEELDGILEELEPDFEAVRAAEIMDWIEELLDEAGNEADHVEAASVANYGTAGQITALSPDDELEEVAEALRQENSDVYLFGLDEYLKDVRGRLTRPDA